MHCKRDNENGLKADEKKLQDKKINKKQLKSTGDKKIRHRQDRTNRDDYKLMKKC